MNQLTGMLLFLLIIVGSLLMVSYINRIQTRNRMIRQKSKGLRRRVESLEEILIAIEPLLESILIPKLINEEILELLDSIQQLEPEAEFVEMKLDAAQGLADKLESDIRLQPVYRAQPSDAAIARAKYHLMEAAKIVRRHHAIGRLDATEQDAFIEELTWSYLMVDVISHLAQGHQAVNRNEPAVAYGYYRKAQNMLMMSHVADNRRHRFIKEITEIFEGSRLAISEDLMPETEYNPTSKPSFHGTAHQSPS